MIDSLQNIAAADIGFTSRISGGAFTPVPCARYWARGDLDYSQPKGLKSLHAVVASGSEIVPYLLNHLDDPRESRCVHELPCFLEFDHLDFYEADLGLLLRGKLAAMDADSFLPTTYTIKVGDLCYVALGQILNRNYSAMHCISLYPVINSPVLTSIVAQKARDEWSIFDESIHYSLLCHDLSDYRIPYRRKSALLRLMYYYPEDSVRLAIRELNRPAYSAHHVNEIFFSKLQSISVFGWQGIETIKSILESSSPHVVAGIYDCMEAGYDIGPFRELVQQTYKSHAASFSLRPVAYDRQTRLLLWIYPFFSESLHQELYQILNATQMEAILVSFDTMEYTLACIAILSEKKRYYKVVSSILKEMMRIDGGPKECFRKCKSRWPGRLKRNLIRLIADCI